MAFSSINNLTTILYCNHHLLLPSSQTPFCCLLASANGTSTMGDVLNHHTSDCFSQSPRRPPP